MADRGPVCGQCQRPEIRIVGLVFLAAEEEPANPARVDVGVDVPAQKVTSKWPLAWVADRVQDIAKK